ncbi:MAG: HAD-IA family hydrolase [Betaproteobacteria bacterium]|nr:HAD-IA family hydrolase [Betaproteobacteria bacterium]MDE2423652.1 HAD-IA family hydrolase [Betaproteobacteria bacterium]
MKDIKLVVFDWDGTLLDSTQLIAKSIQQTCSHLSLPIPDDHQAKFVIGLGLMESLQHVVPTLKDSEIPQFIEVFRSYYLPQESQLSLFVGARELLDLLNNKNKIVAVATGKPRQGLNRSIKHNQLEGIFAFTRCADESRPKPHPEMLEYLMDVSGVYPHETLMIGDTTHDLQMAKNAKVKAVAVSYGAHSPTLLKEEPHLYMAPSVHELNCWINEML